MKISERTKGFRNGYIILTILQILILCLPLLVYVIKGFVEAETVEKVTLSMFAIAAIVLTFVSVVQKCFKRSILWLLLIGVYIVLEKIMPLIIMVAVGTVADEFVITPLKNSWKSKYMINKEIDIRE